MSVHGSTKTLIFTSYPLFYSRATAFLPETPSSRASGSKIVLASLPRSPPRLDCSAAARTTVYRSIATEAPQNRLRKRAPRPRKGLPHPRGRRAASRWLSPGAAPRRTRRTMTPQAVGVDKSSLRGVLNSSAGALEPCARLADHHLYCYAAKDTIGSRSGGARDAARPTTTSTVSAKRSAAAPRTGFASGHASTRPLAQALQLWAARLRVTITPFVMVLHVRTCPDSGFYIDV